MKNENNPAYTPQNKGKTGNKVIIKENYNPPPKVDVVKPKPTPPSPPKTDK